MVGTSPDNTHWIIYTKSDINKQNKKTKKIPLDNYPKIKQHLDKFKSVITSDFGPYGLHSANQQLNLTFEKSITGYIKIIDALGKVFYSYTINNPIIELPIDIANFTNGIYYLNYRNKEVSIHKKFIKQ